MKTTSYIFFIARENKSCSILVEIVITHHESLQDHHVKGIGNSDAN